MRTCSASGYSLVVERDVANVKAGFRLPLPAPTRKVANRKDMATFLVENWG